MLLGLCFASIIICVFVGGKEYNSRPRVNFGMVVWYFYRRQKVAHFGDLGQALLHSVPPPGGNFDFISALDITFGSYVYFLLLKSVTDNAKDANQNPITATPIRTAIIVQALVSLITTNESLIPYLTLSISYSFRDE